MAEPYRPSTSELEDQQRRQDQWLWMRPYQAAPVPVFPVVPEQRKWWNLFVPTRRDITIQQEAGAELQRQVQQLSKQPIVRPVTQFAKAVSTLPVGVGIVSPSSAAGMAKLGAGLPKAGKKVIPTKGTTSAREFETKLQAELSKQPRFEPAKPKIPNVQVGRNVKGVAKEPWQMTRAELEATYKKALSQEKAGDLEVFGTPEKLKRYNNAQKMSESLDPKRAEVGSRVVGEMEDALTEEQRNKLFGIGEKYVADDYGGLVKAANMLDFSSPSALGDSLKYALTRVGNATDPSVMNSVERAAYYQIKVAYEEAIKLGWDINQISESALQGASQRFGDIEDAKFMLQRFAKGKPLALSEGKLAPPIIKELRKVRPKKENGVLNGKFGAGFPPKPPPTALGTPSEFPSGRKPGGIQNQKSYRYTPQEDYNKVVESLTPAKIPFRENLSKKVDSFSEHMLDRNSLLFKLEEETGIPTHKLAQVVPGATAAGEDILRREYMPILESSQKNLDYLEQYMTIMREQDILARNPSARMPGGVGGIGGTVNALKVLKKKVGAQTFKQIEHTAQRLWVLSEKYSLRAKLEAGLISKEDYLAMKSSYPHYLPFQRADFTEEISNSLARPEASVSSVGHKLNLAGSERKLSNPLARAMADVIETQRIIARNKAARSIIEGLKELERQTDEVLVEAVAPAGALRKSANISGAQAPAIAKGEHSLLQETISYFDNGVKYTYNVPVGYGRLAKSLDWEQNNILNNVALALSAPLKKGAVTYNPAFVIINPIRDATSAFFREKLIPLSPEYIRGWIAVVKKDALFSEAAQSGALMSGIVDTMRSTEAMKRVNMLGKLTVSSPKDALLFLPRLLERLNIAGEQATRIATFGKLRAEGVDALEAAIRARDVTVDFAKMGTTMRVINQIIPFSNAGLQGTINVLSTLKRNPKWATIAASPFVAATVLARVNNLRYETSNQIPEYEYTNYWVIQFGEYTKADGTKGPLYLRIPKGPLASMLTFPGEAAFTYARQDNDRSAIELLLEAGREAAKTALPIELTAAGLLPPILQTGVGLSVGRDLYTGVPIIPQREETLLPEQQFGEENSSLAIALGQKFKVSPRKIDFAIKDYFAGAGTTGTWVLSLGLEALGFDPEQYGSRATEGTGLPAELPKIPVVGRFVGAKATRLENIGWDEFNKTVSQTNREFASLPLVNSLGIKLGQVGDNFGQLELTPIDRISHQQTMASLVISKMREAISKTNGLTPMERKRELQLAMDGAKEDARMKFLLTSDITKARKTDSAELALNRKDLSKVKSILLDTNMIVDKRAKSAITNMMRYADPDLDVAMILNGFAQKPRTDKAASLLAQRRAGKVVSLQTNYPSQEITRLRQIIEPYYDIDRYVWSQSPPQLKELADEIDRLERGTIEEQSKAVRMLKQYPDVLAARGQIATLKKNMRSQNKELDYYLDVFS